VHHKATQNLAAAQSLVTAGYFDSAGSRAYYAAYLAGWAWLLRNGAPPPGDYWPHHTFADTLFDWGAIDPDEADDLRLLYQRRIIADYHPDELVGETAAESAEIAAELIARLAEDLDA